MGKIAIITDSVACLPEELINQYQIYVAPAGIITFDGRNYRDWLDISPEEAYALLAKAPKLFATSAISPADFLKVYREVSKEAESLLVVTLSSKLSTLYNMAVAAKELAKQELPGVNIAVLDSQTATIAQGFIALAAVKAVSQGMSLAEVIHTAQKVRDKVGLFVTFDTIQYVYRTGRIPKVGALAGSLLKLKPVVTIRDGVVHFCGITRSKSKGVERIIELTRKKVNKRPVHMAVCHADALKEGESLRDRVAKEFNCVDLWLVQFSPIMGYATGRGVIGLAFYINE